MRILHVTLGFYPAQAWGGPVRIVYQNSKELMRRGHQVTVWCTNLLNKKQKIQTGTFEREIDGIRVVYFNTWQLPWWPGTLGPVWLPDLLGYLRREINSFDIIHLNGYRSPIMLAVVLMARSAGVPIVTQPHGVLPINANTFVLKRIYDVLLGKLELRGISSLIALQEDERAQALKRGIPENIIEVIPNGIDPHEFDDLPERGTFRKRFNINKSEQIILFLGRINKIKGTDMLVEAFAKMDMSNARLIIAGPDDGQLNEVMGLIKKYKLESRIILTGLLEGQDVKAAFLDADLFVLPSLFDAFPTTIMESCFMSVPMVITDRCEIASLLINKVAEVVPYKAQAFSDAMRLMLSDRERYERYKSNCKDVAEKNFSINKVIDRLESVYVHAINVNTKKLTVN